MADASVTINIQNQAAFKAALERAKGATQDLTIPLTLIAQDFFKSEQTVFQNSPGGYPDLAKRTKLEKSRRYGKVYPILVASGALERSLTDPTDANSVNQIINGDTLIIGTTVASKDGAPYPVYLQNGTGRMPARPFLFLEAESGNYGDVINGRFGRWMNILNEFVLKVLNAS